MRAYFCIVSMRSAKGRAEAGLGAPFAHWALRWTHGDRMVSRNASAAARHRSTRTGNIGFMSSGRSGSCGYAGRAGGGR